MLDLYFQGAPCKRGHPGIRRKSTRGCVECEKLAYQKKYSERREAILQKAREDYWANPTKAKAVRTLYREKNRSFCREAVKAWEKNNPNARRTFRAMRRSAILSRTPAWADKAKIREVYSSCPPGMEVDHIIPLLGKLVSGLHVHNNLQYLTPTANKKKGNRHA